MNSATSPADALSRLPGFGHITTWRELSGGLTNRSYLLESGGEDYVLRLDALHTGAFGLDRRREVGILQQAAAAGLAPELVFAEPDSGILLSRYIPGEAWHATDLDDDRKLEALASILRRVHALPPSVSDFDPVAVARRYAEKLKPRHDLHEFALQCEHIVAACPAGEDFRCCHNDVVAGNIVGGRELKLLDWEYACDNDPMFDLASLIGFHQLRNDRQAILLSAYAGSTDSVLRERLESQIRLYDAIQWLWLANRQMITRSLAQAARLEALQNRIR